MTDTMTDETTEAPVRTPGELLQSAIRDWLWAGHAVKIAEEALESAKRDHADKYGLAWSAWGAAGKPVGFFTMYAMGGNKVVSLISGTSGSVNITVTDELKL